MKYSTEPRFRKYVKEYGFLSFARKFGNKYGKKLVDTATKTEVDVAKTTSNRLVQKTKRKRKNKRNRGNLHSTGKKTTDY